MCTSSSSPHVDREGGDCSYPRFPGEETGAPGALAAQSYAAGKDSRDSHTDVLTPDVLRGRHCHPTRGFFRLPSFGAHEEMLASVLACTQGTKYFVWLSQPYLIDLNYGPLGPNMFSSGLGWRG